MNQTRMGRYTILEEVRAGRLTAVYAAWHRASGRKLALKTISPRAKDALRAEARRTLRQEAHVRALMSHPTLLPLYDVTSWGGSPVLLGPWLSGGTLRERWSVRPPLETTLELLGQVGAGLDALHKRGWVHGDLSANNIVFDEEGRPCITDFGSCIPMGSRRSTVPGRTLPGRDPAASQTHWAVTRLTGAPECWSGDPVDGRTDLYSLGAIAYFLLVGSWPFWAESLEALVQLHLVHAVPRPSQLNSQLGPALDQVLIKALAKIPSERFDTGQHLFSSLREAAIQDGLLPGDTEPSSLSRPGLRSLELEPSELPGMATAQRAEAVLQQFAQSLPLDEKALLEAALYTAQRRQTAQRAEAGLLLRSLVSPVAALRAAEDLGILQFLALAPHAAERLAQRTGVLEDSIARLCRFLGSRHWLAEEDGQWTLRPPLSSLYERALRMGVEAHPVAQTQLRWEQLARWLKTSTPPLAMDADESGLGYVESVKDLGDNGEPMADLVAKTLYRTGLLPAAPHILDVGAGSAVWSLALATTYPQSRVTALDRPQVLQVAYGRAQALGLASQLSLLEGDWQSTPLPPAGYDVIFLGRVCHLESPQGLLNLLHRLAQALQPEGRLVIVDTIPDRMAQASFEVLRYDLTLALRTARGRIHDREAYLEALFSAGLEACGGWNVHKQGGSLDVLVARPRPGQAMPPSP